MPRACNPDLYWENHILMTNWVEWARTNRGVERRGACKRCGECCTRDIEFIMRGHTGRMPVNQDKAKQGSTCMSFDNDTRACKHYETRLPVCTLYPVLPESVPMDLRGKCGFYFVDIITGKKTWRSRKPSKKVLDRPVKDDMMPVRGDDYAVSVPEGFAQDRERTPGQPANRMDEGV